MVFQTILGLSKVYQLSMPFFVLFLLKCKREEKENIAFIGQQEMRYIKQALLPVLMCCAASAGEIGTLEELICQVGVIRSPFNENYKDF